MKACTGFRPILFITHDLALSHYISDRAVILYRGSEVEMGSTEEIYGNPLHPYTRMLMACTPRLDQKWEDGAVELKAQRAAPTAGCVYYGRCALSGRNEACAPKRPALVDADVDHAVACTCRN